MVIFAIKWNSKTVFTRSVRFSTAAAAWCTHNSVVKLAISKMAYQNDAITICFVHILHASLGCFIAPMVCKLIG
jgi:hypothetical protein